MKFKQEQWLRVIAVIMHLIYIYDNGSHAVALHQILTKSICECVWYSMCDRVSRDSLRDGSDTYASDLLLRKGLFSRTLRQRNMWTCKSSNKGIWAKINTNSLFGQRHLRKFDNDIAKQINEVKEGLGMNLWMSQEHSVHHKPFRGSFLLTFCTEGLSFALLRSK